MSPPGSTYPQYCGGQIRQNLPITKTLPAGPQRRDTVLRHAGRQPQPTLCSHPIIHMLLPTAAVRSVGRTGNTARRRCRAGPWRAHVHLLPIIWMNKLDHTICITRSGSHDLGHMMWVTRSGSHDLRHTIWIPRLGHTIWVTRSGSRDLGHAIWVTRSGSRDLGHAIWITRSGSPHAMPLPEPLPTPTLMLTVPCTAHVSCRGRTKGNFRQRQAARWR
jgi:hypothetical protein